MSSLSSQTVGRRDGRHASKIREDLATLRDDLSAFNDQTSKVLRSRKGKYAVPQTSSSSSSRLRRNSSFSSESSQGESGQRRRSRSNEDLRRRNSWNEQRRARREGNKLTKRGSWSGSMGEAGNGGNGDSRTYEDSSTSTSARSREDFLEYTYQQELKWSWAERIVTKGLVIHVNPAYYRSTAKPPEATMNEKIVRCCAYTDSVISGPAYITDYMYLGDRHDASDPVLFKSLKITHVVNATTDIANYWQYNAKKRIGWKVHYHNVNLNDAKGVDIMKHFLNCNRFIMKCAMKRGRVLVHCRAGVSRSTTLATAFLMFYESWRLMDTLKYLTRQRFIIDPNKDFRIQLALYEVILFGKSSVKPLLSLQEWDIYRLRELLCQAGIDSYVPDSSRCCIS